MNENKFNSELKKRLQKMTEEEKGEQTDEAIKKILLQEFKLDINDKIRYCACGYPIGYIRNSGRDDEYYWLENIVTQEVDLKAYKRYLICPKCQRKLADFQD